MSRRSAAAMVRSARTDRMVATVMALIALTGGVTGLLVGTGVFGTAAAERPLVGPIVVGWVAAHRQGALGIAIVAGLLLVWLGLWLVLRSVRPERIPDLVLDPSPAAGLTVTAAALSDAVRTDAETVPGVARARVRLVGDAADPAMRITLWLQQGADLRAVWDELDAGVLGRVREALAAATVIPTAVRIKLDTASRQRVV